MKAGAVGGIEAVVKAINTHISNAGVCEKGCDALWNIAFNGKTLDKSPTNKTNEQTKSK